MSLRLGAQRKQGVRVSGMMTRGTILGAVFLTGLATLASANELIVTPDALQVSIPQGTSATSTLRVTASDPAPVTFEAASSTAWLAVTPATGSASSGAQGLCTLQATARAAQLAPGAHTGMVTLTGQGLVNSPYRVPCVMTVTPAPRVLTVYPTNLVIQVTADTPDTLAYEIAVQNEGTPTDTPMAFTVAPGALWIAIPTPTGVCTGTVARVALQLTGLAALNTTRTGLVTVTTQDPAANAPLTIPVIVHPYRAPFPAALSTNRLSVVVTQGTAQASAAFELRALDVNRGPFGFTAGVTAPWLNVQPATGVCNGVNAFTVTADTASMPVGRYRGTVLVGGADLQTNLTVTVGLTVQAAPAVLACAGAWVADVPVGAVVTQWVEVSNTGTGTVNYTFKQIPAWMRVEPEEGAAQAGETNRHAVSFDSAHVVEGVYNDEVRLTASAFTPAPNSPLRIPVAMRVTGRFAAVAPSGASAFPVGAGATSLPVRVWNSGSTNPVAYTLVGHGDWFNLSTNAGSSHGNTNLALVAFDPTDLGTGVHRGWIEIAVNGGVLQHIPLTVAVNPPGTVFEEALVFSRRVGAGDWDIWQIRPDGTGLRPLVEREGDQYAPRISPDGLRLLFRERMAGLPARLTVRDLRTGTETFLADCETPRWMPDSVAVAGVTDLAGGGGFVSSVPIDGSAPRTLMRTALRTRLFGVDLLERLVYVEEPGGDADTRILRYRPASGQVEPLLAGPVRADRRGALSFDGRWAVFESVGATRSWADLLDIERRWETQPVHDFDAHDQTWPAHSPNADRLALINREADADVLCVADTNGAGFAQLHRAASDVELADTDWGFLAQSPHRIEVSATALTAECLVGSTNIVNVQFDLWGPPGATTHYAVVGGEPWGWAAAALGGTSTGEHDTVTLAANPRDLVPGLHTGAFQVVANAANAPVDIAWRLTVNRRPSTLAVVPVTEARGDSGHGVTKTLGLRLNGDLEADYIVTVDQPWLHIENPAGTVSNEGTNVRMAFDPAGLTAGLHTATVSVVSGSYTTSYQTVFSVHSPNLAPPVLEVSTNELRFVTPRYIAPEAQFFTVRNAGGCGFNGEEPLRYTIEIVGYRTNDWMQIQPAPLGVEFVNRGDIDTFRVVAVPGMLAPGTYSKIFRIQPVGSDAITCTARIQVTDPLDYTVTLTHDANIWRVYTNPPPNAASRYAHGTELELVAMPSPGFRAIWTGDRYAENGTIRPVVTNNMTLRALGRLTTMMHGFVTDRGSGEPVVGARVRFETVRTDTLGGTSAPGGYHLTPPVTEGVASVERAGFLSQTRPVTLVSGEWNRVDFALDRLLFSDLALTVPEFTEAIIVDYTLIGPTTEWHRVDLDLSFDQGATWQTPPGYPTNFSGAVGHDVRAGRRPRIFWQTLETYPFMHLTNVLLRLRSGGQTLVSKPFEINTQFVSSPNFLFYHDHNQNQCYDPGEELPEAEVYLGGRQAGHLRGTTDAQGRFTWTGRKLKAGDTVFARKHLHTREAEKSGHGAVDNIMHIVWLDTDVGTLDDADDNAWDGIWDTYTVSRNDIYNLQNGSRLHIPANHPLVEWNLTLDSSDDDPVILTNLNAALGAASRYLYHITDGQMKLNKLYVRSDSRRLDEADVWIRWRYTRAKATVGGIFWNPSAVSDRRIMIGFGNLVSNDTTDAWGRTLIHEFGHYAMGMYDEYRSRRLEDAFGAYMVAHSNLFPKVFGFMHNQHDNFTMSSPNDYLLDPFEYLPSGGDEDLLAEVERYWTEQLIEHGRDCWTFFEDRYQQNYHGRFVNFLVQKSGHFANGTSSVPDRLSAWYPPAPYTICQIRHNDGPYEVFTMETAEGNVGERTSARGAVNLLVRCDGVPCAAAQVGRRRTGNIQLEALGHTSRDGRMRVASLAPGDRILVNYRGRQAVHKVAAAELGGEVVVTLAGAGDVQTTLNAGQEENLLAENPLAEDPLAMLITGRFSDGDYILTLTPTLELAEAPTVTISANDGEATALALELLAGTPAAYEGRIPIADADEWTLDIAARAVDGQTFHSLDLAQLIPVSTNDSVAQSVVQPSTALRTRDTLGMIYQAFGPVPAPRPPTNSFVGPAIHFALADRSALTSDAPAYLSLEYAPTLPAGLDERTLGLYRWNAALAGWEAATGSCSVAARNVEADLDAPGPYALFARSVDDTEAPARIDDFVATLDAAGAIHLAWTAPQDGGASGAAAYELRHANAPFDDASVATASDMPLRLTPAAAGTPQSYVVQLPPEQVWFLALRMRDGAGNWSPLSNLVAVRPVRPTAAGQAFPAQFLSSLALRGFPTVEPDGDLDRDGCSNWDEYLRHTDPTVADTDGDGMPDGFEARHGLDPLDGADATGDADGDGLSNAEECALGSDPGRANTAGDGMDDGWKRRHGLDLLAEADTADDPDRDGVSTGNEYIGDTDPYDGLSYLRVDGVRREPGGVSLAFESSPLRLYLIEARQLAGDDNWRTVTGPFTGTGATWLLMPDTNAMEIYRVRVILP